MQNNENTPEVSPVHWRRPRRLISHFNRAAQFIFASAVWWQNVPKASVLKKPGNAFMPRPLTEEEFKPGPLAEAKVIQKFKDRGGMPYVRLNRGTIVRTGDKVESKTRRHRNEVASRPANLKTVRHSINPDSLGYSLSQPA